MSTRTASHAGSWYENRPTTLSKQLQSFLDAASSASPSSPSLPVRAIIAPHAGFSYSGPTAAFAYRHLNPALIRRIFILGPSHHHYTKQPLLSTHSTYSTPVLPLSLDVELISSLRSSHPSLFSTMSSSVDEDEHSIEMHLPFIAHLYSSQSVPPPLIIPLLIGSLPSSTTSSLASLLSPHLLDPSTFFIVSSDFCHWGSRFSYQHYTPSDGAIWQSIEALDREGMGYVERVDGKGWEGWLREKKDTVCGRHPISVLLAMMEQVKGKGVGVEVQWVRYAQSSRVEKMNESSVSYASAIVSINQSSEGKSAE